MKTLLITISTIILLLFTSCEKDEMGIGSTSGGGLQSSPKTLNPEKAPIPLVSQQDTLNNTKDQSF